MRPSRGEALALGALVALAAVLRFAGIGEQSLWLDEAFTADLVQRPLGDLLSGIAATESTPPLYYLLAWLWEKVFGHGEAGLRSLPALIGTATVPVAWAAAREWFAGEHAARAGLIAAALVAVNSYFVWYSQEARSYALLLLMAGLTLLFLARALRLRTGRACALWALFAALALCTHYFAAFLIAPQAAWLAWVLRGRVAYGAVGGVALAAAALAPLALHQRGQGHTSFIADISLRSRVVDLPRKLVTGELGTPTPAIGPLAGLIVAAAIAYALVRARRPAAQVLLGIVAVAALVPLALALAGTDYLLPRNLIAIYLPLLLLAAAGLAALPARFGVPAVLAVAAVAVVVNVQVITTDRLQRDDWRGAVRAMGPAPDGARAIVLTPEFAKKPLRLYAKGSLPALPEAGAPVREVVVIGNARPPRYPPAPAPPGFVESQRKLTAGYLLVRYTAPAPHPVTSTILTPSKLGKQPAAILIQAASEERNP